MPSAIREIINKLTDDASRGVKNVNNDQTSTAIERTVLPPKRFEKLPPMIFKSKKIEPNVDVSNDMSIKNSQYEFFFTKKYF